jgi:hypothetical protein
MEAQPSSGQRVVVAAVVIGDDDGDDDPDAIHPATGERIGSREEHASAELESLFDLFIARRQLLEDTLTAPEVGDILGISRQAATGRAESGSLLAVLDRGAYRFPHWQFDARGPDGIVLGLPEVLRRSSHSLPSASSCS